MSSRTYRVQVGPGFGGCLFLALKLFGYIKLVMGLGDGPSVGSRLDCVRSSSRGGGGGYSTAPFGR